MIGTLLCGGAALALDQTSEQLRNIREQQGKDESNWVEQVTFAGSVVAIAIALLSLYDLSIELEDNISLKNAELGNVSHRSLEIMVKDLDEQLSGVHLGPGYFNTIASDESGRSC